MAASQADIGYLTKVEIREGDSPAAYFELAEVIAVTPPNQQVDDVEVTHMQSPDRTREYIPGLNEPGEASIEMNWIAGSATDEFLIGLRLSGDRRDVRITWPNLTTWTFLGHVKGYEPVTPIDDRQTVTATLKVDGANTYSYIP